MPQVIKPVAKERLQEKKRQEVKFPSLFGDLLGTLFEPSRPAPAPILSAAPKRKKRVRKERSEVEMLSAYREKLKTLGVYEEASHLDLENDFYWLFRLTEFMALAHRTFEEVNAAHFEGRLLKPRIIWCDRATGGYYNKTRHLIAISLPMTIEHGEREFFETLLHEIAHIPISSHSPKFYALLRSIGGSGKKAPLTILLRAKRKVYVDKNYPIVVRCPQCQKDQRYRTRRALKYACRSCCTKYAGGKFDDRFRFVEVRPE